jgi:protein TonB
MPGFNIAWFLALSMAIHAALLLTYRPAMPEIGHAGHIMQLSVERAGSHSAAPPSPTNRPDSAPEPAIRETTATPSPEPAALPTNRIATTAPRPAAMPTRMAAATSPAVNRASAPTTPSSQSVAAGSPLPSPRESEDHLRRSVLDLFSRRLDYPAIARRKGWQGTVTLRLLIEPDGRISRLQVDRTSGYAALDQAAVESLQLASVPQAKHWLHGRALELLVPVEYRLVGG